MCGVRKLTHTAYANRSTEEAKLRRGPSSEARTAKRRPSGCAYDAFCETSPKILKTKRNTMIALRGQSTWRVFIIHVLSRAFGDASQKTW